MKLEERRKRIEEEMAVKELEKYMEALQKSVRILEDKKRKRLLRKRRTRRKRKR